MRELSIFEAVVEPSVERIPLVDVRCFDVADGRECEISHVVYRNVFTEFDQKLSRHLAAVSSGGFPSVSATIRIRERKPDAPWQTGRSLHFASVPHALRGIANRALRDKDATELYVHSPESEIVLEEEPGSKRRVTKGDVLAITHALDFAAMLGECDFLDISGDYDLIVTQPMGTELRPVTIDLYRGVIAVPAAFGEAMESFDCPLFDFRKQLADNAILRGYLAATRHAMSASKEDAVLTFRAAAETRILNFDRALNGRPLEDYRLDAVISLVARLKAGLGENLSGLAEDAQIVALDWSAAIERNGRNGASEQRFATLNFLLRGPHRAAS